MSTWKALWSWRNAGVWLMAVSIVLLLYALSIGPVVRYGILQKGNSRVVVLAYWPLNEAAKFAPVGKPLAAYVNLWVPASFHADYVPGRGVVFDVRKPSAP